MRLLAAEALKLRTTWGPWLYLGLMVALTALVVSVTIGSRVEPFDDDAWENLLRSPMIGFVFPLLVGSVAFTTEFRHGTIGQTLLVSPRRSVVLAVKLVTAALLGLVLAAIGFVVTLAIALPWLGTTGTDVGVGDPVVRETALALVLAFALLAMLGAAVGGALRSQVGAVVALLVWFLVAELIVRGLLGALGSGDVARYLPLAATEALVGGLDDDDALSQAGGALVLAGWLGAAAAAAFASLRRDVT